MDNIVKLNSDQFIIFNSLIDKGDTIKTMQYIRTVSGIGLAQAKAECEEYINSKFPSFQTPKIKSELDLKPEKMTPEERRLYWKKTISDSGGNAEY
jgi:hypothetical protein